MGGGGGWLCEREAESELRVWLSSKVRWVRDWAVGKVEGRDRVVGVVWCGAGVMWCGAVSSVICLGGWVTFTVARSPKYLQYCTYLLRALPVPITSVSRPFARGGRLRVRAAADTKCQRGAGRTATEAETRPGSRHG